MRPFSSPQRHFPSLNLLSLGIILFFSLLPTLLAAQAVSSDGEPTPSTSAETWLEKSAAIIFVNPDSGQFYAEMALEAARAENDHGVIGVAHSRIGYAHQRKRELDLAEEQFGLALEEFGLAKDSSKIARALLQLGSVREVKRDSLGAVAYYEQAIDLAKTLRDSALQGSCYSSLGTLYAKRGDFPMARSKLIQSISLTFQDSTYANQHMASLGNLAGVYVQLGKFDSAVVVSLESARVCQEIGDMQTLGIQYTNIAQLFGRSGDLDKAIEYCYRGESVWAPMDYFPGLARVKVLLSRFTRQQGDPEKAIGFAQEGLAMCQGHELKQVICLEGLLEWGKALRELGQYEEAIPLYQEVNQLNEEFRDRFVQTQIGLGLAELYNRSGRYQESLEALGKVTPLINQIGSHLQSLSLLEQESIAREGLRQFEKALALSNAAREMNDSLFQVEKLQTVEAMQLEFDVAEKDRLARESSLKAEASRLETRLVSQRLNLSLGIGAAVVVALLALGFWGRSRMQARQKTLQLEKRLADEALKTQQLEEQNLRIRMEQLERQALQAQMNPHFLFNALASLQNHILAGNLPKAEDFLMRFSRLVRNILAASRETGISIANVVEMLRDYLDLEQLRFGDRMAYEISIEDGLETDLIQIPPMLIQPYVENAVVHGIASRKEGGTVRIDFQEKPGDCMEVRVKDNGIGRIESERQKKDTPRPYPSLGTRIAEERLELNFSGRKGEVKIKDLVDAKNRAAGTEVILLVPILEEV